jgi:hypothetical protein
MWPPNSELKSEVSKKPARGRQQAAPTRRLMLAWPHGIVPHRIEFFSKEHGLKKDGKWISKKRSHIMSKKRVSLLCNRQNIASEINPLTYK